MKLESEPVKDVVISVESDDLSEGVVTDPRTSELTFTPRNWDMEREVVVTGVDDALEDGPRNYFVELKVDRGGRFYEILDSELKVYLTNEDDEQHRRTTPPPVEQEPVDDTQPSPSDSPRPPSEETESGGGCTVATGEARGTERTAVNLLLVITILFSAFRSTNQSRYGKSF